MNLGWETTETKKECGCVEIKKQHNFFNDVEYTTISCEKHSTLSNSVIGVEEVQKECGCMIYNYLNCRDQNRFKKLCGEHKKKREKERSKNNSLKYKDKQKEYRENNKEHIAERKKEWRENNKEILSEKNKAYKEANKEKITQNINCCCGGHFQLKHKGAHERSKKHQEYIKLFHER